MLNRTEQTFDQKQLITDDHLHQQQSHQQHHNKVKKLLNQP